MAKLVYDKDGRLLFTKEMKEEYTILMPQMLPVHFGMFRQLLELEGYKVDMLTTNHRGIVDEGLKYVHNDTCYPALLVIGSSSTPSKTAAMTPTKLPCSSPRPEVAAGRPTTFTCCARPWSRLVWNSSPSSPSTCPGWRKILAGL